ncbi:hypothetical protein Hanom_Chr08g00742751 [Helianthus anomalus]
MLKMDGVNELDEMAIFQIFSIQMRKNKPLNESRKSGQTSGTKKPIYSKHNDQIVTFKTQCKHHSKWRKSREISKKPEAMPAAAPAATRAILRSLLFSIINEHPFAHDFPISTLGPSGPNEQPVPKVTAA